MVGGCIFKINNGNFMQCSASANKVNIYKDTSITGRLDVGDDPAYSTNWISLHTDNTNGNGFKGVMQFSVWGGKNGTWDIDSNTTDAKIEIELDGNLFMKSFNNNEIRYHKTLVNSSDDRLKENEEFIENACETSSKLRPQLYYKKPDMENNGPKSWYKESGLMAQEIYYDAPELTHLVYRGSPNQDDEGNEIPTSIDPQQDPDYSPWGKESASVNYIGLIAYLVKAKTELHERVKALEAK